MTNENEWGNDFADEEQGFDSFDTEGVDESRVGNRRTVDKAGKYHFEIADTRERPEAVTEDGKERWPGISLSCVVLETVPGQCPAGTYYYQQLRLAGKGGGPIEDWAKEATINFLVGVGLLKRVEKDGVTRFVDPETKSTRINVKTLASRLKGMQFIGDIKLQQSEQYGDSCELPFGRGAYQVDDPSVADVPKNADALALIGKSSAASGSNGSGAASGKGSGNGKPKASGKASQPKQQEEKETVPPSDNAGAGEDDFSDL
jgi:hypothetical protein